MRSRTRKVLHICTGLLVLFSLSARTPGYGQDVSFSQYYANPLYMNPAFAGTIGAPRLSLQYRDQWHQFKDAYTSYTAAIDLPVDLLQGGLGIYILNDAQANKILNNFQLNLAYSVRVQLDRDLFAHAGVQLGYAENSLKTGELIFADNLDYNGGIPGTSAESFEETKRSYLDYGMGLLLYSKKVFGGLAVHHLTEPDLSFSEDNPTDSKLPRKYTIHAGARLPVFRHGHLRKKFDISPQIIFQKQGISDQINYGLFATKSGLTGGAWFRQNFGLRYDAMILVVGFVNYKFQLTYSYDWTISKLAGHTGGTSEISLAFVLNKRKQANRLLPFFEPYRERYGTP
ncbi:PorP/SprF family type IX secretion system membrane protein [Mangrovibacterium marinum]|uniref:Type IX secretion system PorP/SprF family membrane protein n=1 Tax=Mangrovibacterium marinum TaxID=1639118 RepID=A0A2T5C2I7_9BACT|nr:PorP/SprF family type IX secretion system membrane protein [Mangrovibacterium marinum]PTN08944.1 type IX secretion system PorP/SprF family membrane protein [Mangrovibacterium marinum]